MNHIVPTKDELAAQSGLGYHDYDLALPQGWVDHVYMVTGEWAPHYAIVWESRGVMGGPLALDPEAKALLEEYGRHS